MPHRYNKTIFTMKSYPLLKTLFVLFSLISLQAAAQTAVIKGTVKGDRNILADATVSVGKTGATTDAKGAYTLSVAPGKHTIVASYTGYETQTKTVTVTAGQTVVFDFDLASSSSLNEVVVLGSRSTPRTQLETTVPIDVLDIKKLAGVGAQVNLNQILNFAAPSFTSNTQSLADGTDHVDPASLRGLGPDQVLVLVNGKRRYNSALVNVNGTLGRGSVGTDLNAIPVSSIERIEILRDGASAQYGSDAIAGVINIVLKKTVNKLTGSITSGGYNTNTNGQRIKDGQNVQAAFNYGLPIGSNGGYINFSGSFDDRKPTNRGGVTSAAIYKTYPGGADRSDSFLLATNTTRKDYSLIVGQAQFRSGQFAFNASIPVSENAEFYSFGGFGYRKGRSAGFYRFPHESRNVLEIYPRGFMPYIGSDVYDRSFVTGIRGKVQDWNVDFSNAFGQNQFDFSIENSLNASLGKSSPTRFNAGGPKFTQNTTNIDISKAFDWLSGTNLAFGGEFRYENYQIKAGDQNSYANYGLTRQVGIDQGGNPILIPDFGGTINTVFGPDGSPRPGGAQVFPGFRPENAVSANRTAASVYADAEFNFSKAFLVDAAIRFENYSDFGSTTNGKIAARYKLNKTFTIRGSASTGFRAPSLQQRFYANTATVFTSGVAAEVGTFTNDSRPAQLLGIPALSPEKSQSVSLGFTSSFGKLKLTVDGYFTNIKDRVIYTGQFTGSNAPSASAVDKEIYQLLSLANATGAAFFANALNTDTKGLDVIVSYKERLGKGTLSADLAANFTKTEQVGPIHTSQKLAGKESTYFSNSSRVYLENVVPNTKANLALNYNINKFNIFLRNNYFGKVTEASNVIANQQRYGARVVTDLSVSYKLNKIVNLTIGSNNLLDIYPEKIGIAANSNGGQFIYSRSVQQFGFNGRYLFGRIDVSF